MKLEQKPRATPRAIRVVLSEPAMKALQGLVQAGLFGASVQDVAERMICERLRMHENDGWNLGFIDMRRLS